MSVKQNAYPYSLSTTVTDREQDMGKISINRKRHSARLTTIRKIIEHDQARLDSVSSHEKPFLEQRIHILSSQLNQLAQTV